MRMTLCHRIVPLTLAVITALSQVALAQANLVPYQLTGHQTATRDAHAIAVIETAIGAMAGQAAIAQIDKVQATWISSDPNSPSVASTAIWTDDWSNGFMVFTHQITDGDQGIHILSGDIHHNVQDQEPSGTTKLPQELQDIAIPWCLPASALQLDLNNPAYKFEYLGLTNSIATVRITRIRSDGLADLNSIQTWLIDLKTGFPSGVHFFTLNLLDHTPYPQTVEFNSYQQRSGVEVPTALLFNATDHPSLLTLKSISFN